MKLERIMDYQKYFFLLQNQTMQMMYEIIAQELKSMNMEGVHPQDYLNFYCLGNRELVSENNDMSSDNQPEKSGPAVILNYFYSNFSKFLLVCSYYL